MSPHIYLLAHCHINTNGTGHNYSLFTYQIILSFLFGFVQKKASSGELAKCTEQTVDTSFQKGRTSAENYVIQLTETRQYIDAAFQILLSACLHTCVCINNELMCFYIRKILNRINYLVILYPVSVGRK